MRLKGLCLLGAGTVLIGCGGGTAPLTRDRILVVRSATGPVITKLRQQFGEDVYTGFQSPSKYKLIVLDGSTVAPQEVQNLSLIKDALAKGVSVLLLNASEAHKQALMTSKCVPAQVKGDSAAYLVTPGGSARQFHLTNLRPLAVKKNQVSHSHDDAGFLLGQAASSTTNLAIEGAMLDSFMSNLQDRLADQGRATSAPTPPADYPSTSWFQTSVTESWNTGADSTINNQSIGHDITYTFYAYYDNGATLGTHAFQWVAMAMQGNVNSSSLSYDDTDNRGWGNTLFQAELTPVNTSTGNGLDLALVNAQPTSSSNSLNSSMEFNIGYKGTQGNTAWLWQQSLGQSPANFGDWDATSPPPSSGNNAVALLEEQTSPFNGDGSNWTDAYYNVFAGKHIHPMSGPASGTLNVLGQALWKTFEVTSDTVQIDCSTSSKLIYLHVKNYFVAAKEYYSAVTYGTTVSITLDLGQLQPPGGN